MTNIIKVPFQKLTKVLHLADIHIRLYKRHDEYREVFATLYDQLRQANDGSSVIVVAGDIVHAKTDLSPEIVVLTTEFLSTLATIAPTLVIPGNHDLNLANQSRLDALSPIIAGINNDNLHYLKESGIYYVGEVPFGVYSIIGDSGEWPSPVKQATTNIALFHGPIHNAQTDIGYTVTSRHHTVDLFDGYDIALLGDIHRHQSLQAYSVQEGKPVVVYPSSLIQQNHGESLTGHGWCEWDIDTRSFIFHELPNSYGYYTLTLDNGKVPPHPDMPKNVRLRIFAGDTPQTEIKKLVADIRQQHTIHELAISTHVGAAQGTTAVVPQTLIDIADVNYQNSIITEYLRDAMPNISDETLDKVVELNKQKNTEVGSDVVHKIFWKPLQLKFNNLFTYGEDNFVDFTTKTGLIGIFAPNASGKTSIAEAICFALYDRTPRTTKAASIMNYSQTKSYCEFKFELAGKVYVIERTGKKNTKDEVKMDVNFYELDPSGNKISLNGEERRYTNEVIREYVGSYEDFILTTFSSSTQAGLLVDRGQSDRKDLLSQFMGLGLLDRLYTTAHEESKEIAGALKSFKNDDFTTELADIRRSVMFENSEQNKEQAWFDTINKKLNNLRDEITKTTAKKLPLKSSNPDTEEKLIKEQRSVQSTIQLIVMDNNDIQAEITKIEKEIAPKSRRYTVELGDVEDRRNEYLRLDAELTKLQHRASRVRDIIEDNTARLEEAKLHKFDPNCQFCVENGQHIIDTITEAELAIRDAELEQSTIDYDAGLVRAGWDGLGDIRADYNEWKALGQELLALEKKSSVLKDKLITNRSKITDENTVYVQLGKWILEKQADREAIENNKKVDEELTELNIELAKLKKEFNTSQSKLTKVAADLAVRHSKEADILRKIKTAEELESKYEAYEAYLLATHRDGLQYKLITDALPMLESSVNDILKQMAEFHLKFEMDGKNVNMKICYDIDRIWPLELASGMEKFISGLAIRVALMSISNLPKSNFLIIDEGLGALDADNLASIYMLFDVLKAKFDFIFLISHIDTTRDIADSLIDIERKNGVSRIYSA